jgi:hypothetical protein
MLCEKVRGRGQAGWRGVTFYEVYGLIDFFIQAGAFFSRAADGREK